LIKGEEFKFPYKITKEEDKENSQKKLFEEDYPE